MKMKYRIIAIVAMFFMIIAMLLTSFQVAIYGDSEYKFYQKEYEKYAVTEYLHMEIDDVMEVTDYMMDFLIGKEEELSIVTDVDGKNQDFFNDQDRFHMGEVRDLFLGGLKIRNVLAILSIILLAVIIVRCDEWKSLIPKSYSWALLVFLGVLGVLGIFFVTDFDKCFTIFHHIFFDNDLWLFDPRTDYMIRMLPEGFFADMLLRIIEVFLLYLAAGKAVFVLWKKLIK